MATSTGRAVVIAKISGRKGPSEDEAERGISIPKKRKALVGQKANAKTTPRTNEPK